MKAPKEIRQYINRRKRMDAKPNGVVRWLWEAIERKMATNKRVRAAAALQTDKESQ